MTDHYTTTVLADEPVGYWRLNEQSLTNQVVDESGHGHHGTFHGSPVLSEPGAIQGSTDKSIKFVPPSYIEIPHSPEFSIPTSVKGLTVEVWMRPDTLEFPTEEGTTYIHWLGKGDPKKMEWGFRFYTKSDPDRPSRIAAYAWNPQGGLGAGAYCPGELVKESEWLHLVACYEHYSCPCGKQNGVQMFVNGVKKVAPPSPGTLYFNEGNWTVVPRPGNTPLRIGTRSATANSFLTGRIDEVAIYPKVLTPERIRQHYEAGMGRAVVHREKPLR